MGLNRYDQFFDSTKQFGYGPVADFGNVYKRGGIYYQSGRGSFGTVFSGILRLIKPFLIKTGRALGEEALRSSGQILGNLNKKPLKELLREQRDLSLKNLVSRAETGLKAMSFGQGMRSRTINRPGSSMESLTFYPKPVQKRSRSVSTRRKKSQVKRKRTTRSQSRRRVIKKKKPVKKVVRKIKRKSTNSKLKADFLSKYLPK